MLFDRLIKFFLPQDRNFFPLFVKATENLVELAQTLDALGRTTPEQNRTALYQKIQDLEHKGDDITHQIFTQLGKSFITPFDREDIHELASAIDDVADFIHGGAKRLELYQIDVFHPAIPKLADLILKSAIAIDEAVKQLKGFKDVRKITDATILLNTLENHADDIYDAAISELFDKETDAKMIIKTKEILSSFEGATDRCEDVANVLESIYIKFA